MRKLTLVICAALCLSMAGCGEKDTGTPLSMEVLEEYSDENQGLQCTVEPLDGSTYGYLNLYAVRYGTMEVDLFLPGEDAEAYGSFGAASESHGIGMMCELYTGAEYASLYDALGDTYTEEYASLTSRDDISGISVDSAVEGDGWVIQSIDYAVEDEENIYACRKYIKADMLDGGYILTTTITVDNSCSDSLTQEVLGEALEAAGISLEEEEGALSA